MILAGTAMDDQTPIVSIKGIGPKTEQLFAKMGVYTTGDILLHFPRTYIRYPKAVAVDEITSLGEEKYAVAAKIGVPPVVKSTRSMQITLLTIGSSGHKMEIVWYRMPYLKNTLIPGKYFVFYGKVMVKHGHYVMEQPVVYSPEAYQQIEDCFQPVYSLTAGVTNNLLQKTLRQVLASRSLLSDVLPLKIRQEYELCEYNYAMKQIHFPDSMGTLVAARRRLVFDEFFFFLMGMRWQKEEKQRSANGFVMENPEFVNHLVEKLPYPLTGAQQRTLKELIDNMQGPYAMQRLIQGDVGSGKTIIAFLVMAWCAFNGCQSAIMAPTEVLARQHYETFLKLCRDFALDFPVILLTGSMTAKEKKAAYEALAKEKSALVVGTHALIQEKAIYSNLSLVITDEQHRFGVRQRNDLAEKGHKPHTLVMSATPIPRTLAIILYGDMDISVIDEVPARRLPIKNCVVNTAYRPKAFEFISDQIHEGHQAYIICPLVEESENTEAENVKDYAAFVKNEMPADITIGVLHGRMKNEKKNQVMEQFVSGKVQLLVSTTVVEVGVNVPNATVMMIENANRFGLAQLHQLRGRVGRGDAQSYCIMVNTSDSAASKKRLEILNHSNDGFQIASEDLKLRGPGDFFGIRQSGDMAFQLADIYQDARELRDASAAVTELLAEDPLLSMEDHRLLREQLLVYQREHLGKMTL